MADRFLAGNGKTCPECAGDGWVFSGFGPEICAACSGTGRAALDPAAIIAAHVSENQSRAKEALTS